MSLVHELDYGSAKRALRKRWGRVLSAQELEDSYHDSLEYMLRNPTKAEVKPITALLRVFKTMRYYEYRKKFIDYNGAREPVYVFSFDPAILNQEGDGDGRLSGDEVEIIRELVDTGDYCDNEFTVPPTLTERELSVISMLLEGWKQTEIAHYLSCTPQAVDSCKKKAFKKIREAHDNVIHA